MKFHIRELEPALSAKEKELVEEKKLKETLTKQNNDINSRVRELEGEFVVPEHALEIIFHSLVLYSKRKIV